MYSFYVSFIKYCLSNMHNFLLFIFQLLNPLHCHICVMNLVHHSEKNKCICKLLCSSFLYKSENSKRLEWTQSINQMFYILHKFVPIFMCSLKLQMIKRVNKKVVLQSHSCFKCIFINHI